MTAKHIAIWGAWYGSHNVGDQATLICIAQILEQALGKIKLTVFTNKRDHVLSYGSSESGCQVEALQNRSQFHRILRTLGTCHLFIIGGGVPFFQQPKHLLIMATLVAAARASGTPYMTWAVGSQAVTSPTAKLLFKWVLNGADAITCRDQTTIELFVSCGVARESRLVADPVFGLKPDPKISRALMKTLGDGAPERPLAALIPRSLRGQDRSANVHYKSQTMADVDRNQSNFAAATDWLWDYGYQPIFVPMNTVAPDDDRQAAHAQHGRCALLVDQEVRPPMVPTVLSKCRLAFSGRVHGAVTAMIANCPTMMYSFDVKHRGIMESMNLGRYVLDARNTSPDQTRKMLETLAGDHQIIRRKMTEHLTVLQNIAKTPGEIARKILIDQ